uniref:non-specific serine/threonine protein kinase n=2 Tax=Kalanchoe fedtschenkoi TaxID=63787 RepID=A0A7N0V1F4_KALFE
MALSERAPEDMEEAAPNHEVESKGAGNDGNVSDDQSSPRGVLEIPVSGTDSDSSCSIISSCNSSYSSSSSSALDHSVPQQQALPGDGLAASWRSMIGAFKKRSARRFSSIPSIVSYELSKRNLKKKLGRVSGDEETIIDCEGFPVLKPSWRNFDSTELAAATDNYSPEKLVGQGGHAQVYRGCLPDGQIVAVKKLVKNDKEEEERTGDFLSELGIIAHINHPNAAKLLGFGVDSGLHLVLEFSPHGSLATALQGSEVSLDWKKRYNVALGVAEGLQYLHGGCHRRIIHRDIKASNILLGPDYEAQISDFGLAKWLPEKWAHHVVHPIEGTFGYLAPEYFMHGVVNEKTDVFAFGVLLLEIITGRRAVDSFRQSLVMWAKPLLEADDVAGIADPRLCNDYDPTEMKRVMTAASMCIHHSSTQRPSMKKVLLVLKGKEAKHLELKQKSFIERPVLVDADDPEGYTNTTYLKDLNRHMQLMME